MEDYAFPDKLLEYLIAETGQKIGLPQSISEKRKLLRSLMNIRAPLGIPGDILSLQDQELKQQAREKGIIYPSEIPNYPGLDKIKLWQGDMTRLAVDAIVNAANSQMLGCFIPCHGCIDNGIHSGAGMQLRQECSDLMKKSGKDAAPGEAIITRAYNLPAKFIIHTVGPIVKTDEPTSQDRILLQNCYENCLVLAQKFNLSSIAFCCISTGVFHFPQKEAAEIAVKTVLKCLSTEPGQSLNTVIFDVFSETDLNIYKEILDGKN